LNINALHTNFSADITLLYFFYGFEKQGLAIADLVHGNREMSLHFASDWILVLAKQGRSLRSEIVLIVAHFPCHV
jgi:deoxycytidylate deaminase